MLEFDAASSLKPQVSAGTVKADDLRWPIHRGLLLFLVSLTGLDFVWMALSDLDLAFWPAAGRFGIIGALLLGAGCYGLSGRSLRISATLLAVAELLWITLAGTMLSYLAIRAGFPLVDSEMASLDAAIGFDWPAYEAFITSHLWIHITTELLYPTSILQIAVVVLTLGFSGRLTELLEFTAGLTIAAVLTVVIGAMLPALGAYNHFNVPGGGIFPFVPAIVGAHGGALQILDLTKAEGLVFFPSYHTAISIGIVAACWPLKYLRYPALLANAVLIAGVPVWGSHYLVDVIGGVIAMVIVLLAWRRGVGA
jgi:hypothetical protein